MSSNENIDFNGRVKRLYLNVISRENMLNRKDIRSIRNWCKDNSVRILKDLTGEYVIEEDYNLAYNAPVIANLKQQHGTKWQTVYPYYIKGELYKLADIKVQSTPKPTKYTPKGRIAARLLSKN